MKLPLSSVERETARQGIIGKTKKQDTVMLWHACLCKDNPQQQYIQAQMSIDELKYPSKLRESDM